MYMFGIHACAVHVHVFTNVMLELLSGTYSIYLYMYIYIHLFPYSALLNGFTFSVWGWHPNQRADGEHSVRAAGIHIQSCIPGPMPTLHDSL